MTKTRNRRGNFLGTVFGAAIVLVAVTLPGRAFAQFSNGTITGVTYSFNGGSPQLVLDQQDPNNSTISFVAPRTAPMGCSLPQLDMDTIKTWQSIAQGAKLSGKSTTIYYTACNGTNYLNDLVMSN